MRKIIFLMAVVLTMCNLAAFAEQWQIDYGNVSDPVRLQQLLQNRFDTVETDITNLKSQNNLGTGKIFYVDSAVGSNSYDGTKPEWARATLDAAVALCTDNNGDVIYVMQNHAENLSGADGVDIDIAGITVIGLGSGLDSPTFTFTNAAGEFVIGAANVTIYNLTFQPAVNIVTHCIDIENAGDYAKIYNCYFLDGATAGTDEFVDCIQVGTTATDVTIANCTYYGTGTNANNFVDLSDVAIANPTVVSNKIYGKFLEAGIWGGAAVPTSCLIAYNIVSNTTTGQLAIEFQGAASGACIGNLMYTDTWGTLGAGILDPGSLTCIENYGQIAADKSASLVPSASLGQTIYDQLMGGDGIATWPTAASYANGVSIAEALAYTQDGVRKSGGTAMGTSKGVADALGTTGVALVDDAVSIAGIIGIPTDVDNAVASTAIVSNPDGSLYERMEYLQKLQEILTAKQMQSVAGSGVPLAVWYVDGDISESGDGKSPATAFKTLDAAIEVCSDSVDDWVLVYDYSGSTATITINKSFVHFIGGGRSGDKPWARIKPSDDVAGITVVNGKGGIEIANFVIGGNTNHAGIEWQAGVVADSYYIHDCVFGWDNSSLCQQGIEIAATADAPSLMVENCRFFGTVSENGILIAGNATKGIITHNFFQGIGTTATPTIHVSSGGVGIRIENNRIMPKTDQTGCAIVLSAASSLCWVNNNYCNEADAAMSAIPYTDDATGGSNGWGMNYYDVRATLPN